MILFSHPFARRKECGNASQTPEELITREVTLNKLCWSSIITIGSPKVTLNSIFELLSPSPAGWISWACHTKNSCTFKSFLIWSTRLLRYNLFDFIILIIGLIDWFIEWLRSESQAFSSYIRCAMLVYRTVLPVLVTFQNIKELVPTPWQMVKFKMPLFSLVEIKKKNTCWYRSLNLC